MEIREFSIVGWGFPVAFLMDEQEIRTKHDRSMMQLIENRGLLKLFHIFCGKVVDKL